MVCQDVHITKATEMSELLKVSKPYKQRVEGFWEHYLLCFL